MRTYGVRLGALVGAALVAGVAPGGRRGGEPASRTFVIEVPGIPGPYCAYGIEKRLQEVAGVTGVVMDWEAEELHVRTGAEEVSADDVAAAVEASEYPYDYTVR